MLAEAGPIRLRRLRAEDVDDFLAYRADPEVMRYQSWAPMARPEALRFIDACARAPLFALGEWCQIAVADADTDHLVGDMGLHLLEGRAELGISLARAHWGKGWGTAAFDAAARLAFDETNITRVIGAADARNTASLRMMEKAGFAFSHRENHVYDGEACTDHVHIRWKL